MTEKEKLYETMGELLYAVAMADGVIQKEEKEALKKLLENHSWAKEVNWSFSYEEGHKADVEDIYNKVISYCHSIGPSPVYVEFVEAMNIIAQASGVVTNAEQQVITGFSKDLTERFKKDFERLNGED